MSEETLYRCAECGNGAHLSCWSLGLFEGPLGADGSLTRYDDFEDTEVQESSIRCAVHGDCIEVHRRIGGVYHRYERCGSCNGDGKQMGYMGRRETCQRCWGEGGKWIPIESVAGRSGASREQPS